MPLKDLQRTMMQAVERGPDHVDHSAFLGSTETVLRGFSVHANTIPHARLIALEESFPRTRAALGEAQFNALSRQFSETATCKAQPLTAIGKGFADHLSEQEESHAASLAGFEWAWLDSYHAAEAVTLSLADLAGLSEEALLNTTTALHPAARLIPQSPDLLPADEFPGIGAAAGILITRPESEMRVSAACPIMIAQYKNLTTPQPVCNLLAFDGEEGSEDGLRALLAMIEAGSLVLAI